MNVKAKELAKMLGISPASVSLVLNNKPGVSEATRNKVFSAMKEFGCEDLLPKSMEEKRTILFMVYRKNGTKAEEEPYFWQIFSRTIEGVEAQVKNCGYKLMVSYVDMKSLPEEVEKLQEERIDGLLLLATDMEQEQMKLFTDKNLPTVIIDNYLEKEEMDCVEINNEQGVDLAVSHLAAMGHKNIGYLHTSEQVNNFQERYYGFLRSMRKNKLALNEENILELTATSGEVVYQQLKEQLGARKQVPTAFFADNDIIAVLSIRAFREMGYRIPEDISIVGFDNISLSELLDPPLTTIQTPKYEIGCAAVNTLVGKIEGTSEGIQKVAMRTTLIERSSVKQL
jgi:Transcriptional regulators